MNRINISENKIGRIIFTSPYDPLLVAKAKTFPDYRLHPVEKLWSFPTTDGAHVSSRDLMKIKNPLDQILESKGGGRV